MRVPVLLVVCCAPVAVFAQDHGSITSNPYSTPEDRAAGMRSFSSACAACHGREGAGGSNGPSLTTGTFKHGNSDGDLFRTITKGVPDTPMVAFPYEGREVWQLITFIRSLNIAKGSAGARGDPAKGAVIFASNGCGRCHTVGFEGGFTGPDLSDIALRRTLAQLKTSIVNPNAEVAPDYWSLRAQMKSGKSVTGIRLNEDMDSFQIREPSGKLRSLPKSQLASWEIVRASPMPPFENKLRPSELEDLVTYLASLRTGEAH
jgi:putative heme-binding domain-containing protein